MPSIPDLKQRAYSSVNTCFSWKTTTNWHIQMILQPRPYAFDILNWKHTISAAREASSSAKDEFA